MSLLSRLNNLGQTHLVEALNAASPGDRARLERSIESVDSSLAGGLESYVQRAQTLLKASADGVSSVSGAVPNVPLTVPLVAASAEFAKFEKLGEEEYGAVAYFLVAGGMGERLGHNGIKIELPADVTTGRPFLQLYMEDLIARQDRHFALTGETVKLPMAIMTSDQSNAGTERLLQELADKGLGLPRDQVSVLVQQGVPALLDSAAKIALDPADPFSVLTKPHGHGDVHTLLAKSGLLAKWVRAGIRWVFFFQDTNPLAHRGLAAMLGVSKEKELAMNMMAVARCAGEAVGAIARLDMADGTSMTCNVEYNELGPLLMATGDKRGDVADPKTGKSIFPGNVNVLLLDAEKLLRLLEQTDGNVVEFVNPKYSDSSKTTFKSPTRLECMMQDVAKCFHEPDQVGVTQFERWLAFTTVKNSIGDAKVKAAQNIPPECALSAEADYYHNGAALLKLAIEAEGGSCELGQEKKVKYNDIEYPMGPRVVAHPNFGVSLEAMKKNVPKGHKLSVGTEATLVLNGKLPESVKSVEGDGYVEVSTDGKVKSGTAKFVPATDEDGAPLSMRGYKCVKSIPRNV